MKETLIKLARKKRRLTRGRKKILASKTRARLTVFRSNKYIYAQIIDDTKGVTLASVSEKEIAQEKGSKVNKAEEIGKKIAQKAIAKKVKTVVFDKGPYRYHGRIKALAEGARSEGLIF